MFLIKHRFPTATAGRRERQSVYWTNLGILGLGAGLSLVFGLQAYFVIQLTALAVAGSAGVRLYYVQHQFEGVYWQHQGQWDYLTAALQGSSFYKLTRILQWFLGNIGVLSPSSLKPADSHLQSGALSRRGDVISNRAARNAVWQPQSLLLPPVG